MRETGCIVAYCVAYSFGLIGPLAIFIVIAITMFSSSALIPIGEEKTRQHLVDYLQNNEKINRKKNVRKKKNIAKANSNAN